MLYRGSDLHGGRSCIPPLEVDCGGPRVYRKLMIPRGFVRVGAVPFRGQGLRSQCSNPNFVARDDYTSEFPVQAKNLR